MRIISGGLMKLEVFLLILLLYVSELELIWHAI
jgi:hypothetical protein